MYLSNLSLLQFAPNTWTKLKEGGNVIGLSLLIIGPRIFAPQLVSMSLMLVVGIFSCWRVSL